LLPSLPSSLSTLRPPPRSTLFPYTTLFRSLVKVNGRRAEQRPIAGTRPRAQTTEEDLERARELLADEKERAEHVMLVDLGRNDLDRKSTRLNSSHRTISYAVFCLKKKTTAM